MDNVDDILNLKRWLNHISDNGLLGKLASDGEYYMVIHLGPIVPDTIADLLEN